MTMLLSISILVFVAVVSARSAPFEESDGRGFDTVPVRSPESRPGAHAQASLYTNNNRGFAQGQERTHDDNNRRGTSAGNQRNIGVSEHLNSELQHGDESDEIELHPDTEQRRSDVDYFNLDFDRRENTDNTQRSGVQGYFKVETDDNTHFTSKTQLDEHGRITENYRPTTNLNHKNSGSVETTQNSNVRTNNRNIVNRNNEAINFQYDESLEQTFTAVSNNDNKRKPLMQNSAPSQNARSGTVNDPNVNVQENNNRDIHRSSSTGQSVPAINNNENNQPKVTQENEVTPKTSQEGRGMISRGGTRNNNREIERWIWSDGETVTQATTVPTSTVDLDDRAAFNGDKCPSGKVRFGNSCVDEV